MITAEDHQHFADQGFVLLKALVARPLVDRLLEPREANGLQSGVRSYLGDDGANNGCLTADLLAAAGELVGATPLKVGYGPIRKSRPHVPHEEWQVKFHIDNHYPTIAPVRTLLSAVVFLTDVGRCGGAFCVVPGSHHTNRRHLISSTQNVFFRTSAALGKGREILASAGDVLFFHYLLEHGSSSNTAGLQSREALVIRFHADARGRPQKTSALPPVSTKGTGRASQDSPVSNCIPVARPREREGADVLSHVVLRHQDRVHRIWVDSRDPSVLLTRDTCDLARWSDDRVVSAYRGGPIESLSLGVSPAGFVLVVSRSTGTQVFLSAGPTLAWKLSYSLDLPAGPVATIWASRYASKILRGTVIYRYNSESRLIEGSVPLLEDGAHGSWASRTSIVMPGKIGDTRMRDLVVGPIISDVEFVMMIESEVPDGSTRVCHARSGDVSQFDSFAPLGYTSEYSPSCVRLYDRANLYWLVCFLQAGKGRPTPRWGVIDWDVEVPLLEEITTRPQLERAYRRIGLR